MTMMGNPRLLRSGLAPVPRRFSTDVALAERTTVPVLISGDRKSAVHLALVIAAVSGSSEAGEVKVVDAIDANDLGEVIADDRSVNGGVQRTVVLCDVHMFSAAQQAALLALIDERVRTGRARRRVIATTSVSLFDRVVDGS